MPLRYVRGSLFDSEAQTLVNPVNTVGVSGAGLAKEFKKRFRKGQKLYEEKCRKATLQVGDVLLWNDNGRAEQWVLYFPTKEHWRDPSEIEFIERGLQKFAATYGASGITSIAFPALGCGNGGLAWEDVRHVMERYLSELPIPVAVHLPLEATP